MKKAGSHAQCVKCDIYTHINPNLASLVVTLALIIIKKFVFVISCEISATWKQNDTGFDTEFPEILYEAFKLKRQINLKFK